MNMKYLLLSASVLFTALSTHGMDINTTNSDPDAEKIKALSIDIMCDPTLTPETVFAQLSILKSYEAANPADFIDTHFFLHHAVKAPNLAVVKSLLAKGANPNHTNENNCVPIGLANTPEMMNLLIKYDADPLHSSCPIVQQTKLKHADNVNFLLKTCGIDPDLNKDEMGNSLLNIAANNQDAHTIKVLTIHNATIEQKNNKKQTPLDRFQTSLTVSTAQQIENKKNNIAIAILLDSTHEKHHTKKRKLVTAALNDGNSVYDQLFTGQMTGKRMKL